MSAFIENVVPGGAELGESPVWDSDTGYVWWVDITRGRLHWSDGDCTGCRDIGEEVGAVALRRGGGLVLAVRSGIVVLDRIDAPVRRVALFRAQGVRCNDAKCDSTGRLWAGTLADDKAPGGGSLYRVESDGRVRTMLDDVTVSNGLDWSPDGRTLYYVDSATQRVDAIAFDALAGTLGERRCLLSIPVGEGVPDGLTVDAAGDLWLALFGGSKVIRIAPDGTRLGVLEMPVSHPTSCAFGGPDLSDLYVTSACRPLSAAERRDQPSAGGLFRTRIADARGRLPNRFAG